MARISTPRSYSERSVPILVPFASEWLVGVHDTVRDNYARWWWLVSSTEITPRRAGIWSLYVISFFGTTPAMLTTHV